MDDRRIIELYFNRDEQAIKESKDKYGPYCFAVAKNILGSAEDAEECVSTALLKAWNSIPPNRPGSLKLYLAKLTRRASLDRADLNNALKRGGGELPLVLDELRETASDGRDPLSELEAKELASAVNAFLRTLPELDRNLFIRRCFFAEAVPDIAERYGISRGAADARLSRTRKKLRAYLEKEGLIDGSR
ncbi:MAG: sigma-70 family RNA polymerase sigma factor [Clostridia bacterium]|nr:sigma-70 family RNA polymerase sigma factor [Clostridia bacterium]